MGDQLDNKRRILNKDDAVFSSGTSDSKRDDRRRALKSAMTAAGIAGVATWSRPVVESIVLPAHAETSPSEPVSEPVSMSGSLTDTNTLEETRSTGGAGNLANAVLGSVVGTAHAAIGTPPDTSDNALVAFDHCISLEFPNGVAPGNTVNVSISGPDFDGEDGGTADVNANGSAIATLDGDLNFTANITGSNPNLTVEGCVDDDFGGAFGFVSADASSTVTNGSPSYYIAGGTAGDGAFWEVSTGGSCSAYGF